MVASEVKQLAGQTSKATEQIGETLRTLKTKLELLSERSISAQKAIEKSRHQVAGHAEALETARAAAEAAELEADTQARLAADTQEAMRKIEAKIAAQAETEAGHNATSSDDGPLKRSDIELVQQSFAKVTPIAETAAELFYNRLFEIDPSLKSLFTGDMKEQGRKLMEMIAAAVAGLDDMGVLVPVVQELGVRHAKYGVKPAHYGTVAEALLWTLEQGLGDAFTSDIRQAWIAVYTVLAEIMTAAAAQA